VQLDGPKRFPAGARNIYAIVKVDSNDIGNTPVFSSPSDHESTTFDTCTEVEGNMKLIKKLQFDKLKETESIAKMSPSYEEILNSLGTIEVTVYETILVYDHGGDDYDWDDNPTATKKFKISTKGIVDAQWAKKDQKILYSNTGTLVKSTPITANRRPRSGGYVWTSGRFLQERTFRYGSATVLCAMQVAPPRGSHEALARTLHRWRWQYQQESLRPLVVPEPTKIVKYYDEDKNVVKEIELFDMTQDEDE